MDYSFPDRLFPTYFSSGPPNCGSKHTAGGWGEYKGILNTSDQGACSEAHLKILPRRRTGGDLWAPSEPLVQPLLPPKPIPPWLLDSSETTDFGQHMEDFYRNHSGDAFGSVGALLQDHFYLGHKRKKSWRSDALSLGWTDGFLSKLEHRKCEYTYLNRRVVAYDNLLRDALHDIPPTLLGGLLQEELQHSGQRLLFSETATGGALAHAALPRDPWLLYAAGPASSLLNFQRVSLRSEEGDGPRLDACRKPTCVDLKGPVRQISVSALLSDCCVAVRSDYLCGVWRFNEVDKPKVLQVITTKQPVTCITASPHVLGEVLLADESGSVHLWTVGKGMTQVRREDSNLYFNASSPWRWCEFSAHPRVMLYGDRTGMELTDARAANAPSFTLFRISRSPQCRSGERVVLGRYLADANPFHHLVTTQYSAYIMDERFPVLPMLKWDHMMQAPPIFAQVLPGHASSSVGGSSSTKVVIGSQSSQEIVMLQYSGGSAEPCVSLGSPQQLLSPRDSLDHLPVQLPHRTEESRRRLAMPAAGMTCFPGRRGGGGGEDSICVLQLTEAGDVFYQVLRPELGAGPDAAGQDPPLPPPGGEAGGRGLSPSQRSAGEPRPGLVAEDTGSEEDMIGPTQPPGGPPPVVPETPERGRGSGSSSEEEGLGGRRSRYQGLEVVVNEEEGQADAATLREKGEVASAARMDRPAPPSARAAEAWRHWLQQLLRCRSADRAQPTARKRRRAKKGAAHDPLTEDRLQSLRRDLGESMLGGSLLLHGATSLPAVAPPRLPDTVRTKAWGDVLSQRLTVSWQGEEQWKAWWSDKLGLNRKERAEALKRRRSRDKARRRSNRSLSGSSLANPGSSWAWSDPDDASSRWSEPGSPRSTVSQSARWSEPGSPRSTVSQSARWSEPGSPRSTVSQSARWSEPGSPRSTVSQSARWSEPGSPRSTVSQSARLSEPGSPRSTVSQSARLSEPGSPRSTVSQSARLSEPGSPRSTVSQSGRWSEPDSPRSTVSRASQLQHWSPGFSLSGSLPNPKEGPPRHPRLLDVEDDLVPPSSSSQLVAGGSVPSTPRPHTPGPLIPTPRTPRRSQASQAFLGRPGSQTSAVKRKRSQMGF
ncbi:TATA box-binding protein-associated factor, RNA polymerase I, subunit C isoform X2 [Gadus morhua]|uniref:TATA box-binding protein-associated factor, RNA polymerase I, subunit C isoform X2 n=1 Tax=Gadus morhua TaxID=8049 RepID=UPI0011B40550|nr:TATA box-binding protein-associated factor RNA polymerase I subunit C isoform X2 [Gadus morhua]